jgi:GMP synthase (glutamine-hydrolysing)
MNILLISMYSNDWNWKKQHLLYKKAIGKNAKLYIKRYHDTRGIKKILENKKISGIIVSGSDFYVLKKGSPKVPGIIFKYNIPMLFICYGLQYLAIKNGKRSNINSFKNGMKTYIKKVKMTYPFKVKKMDYVYYHQDYVININNKYKIIKKLNEKIVMIYNEKNRILGIQFHPEYIYKTGRVFFKKWIEFIARK